MKHILILIVVLFSCTKNKSYTCVCYNKQVPENYIKYKVNNTYEEANTYCNLMSNSQQKCYLSE
jgi:hypothetical protein